MRSLTRSRIFISFITLFAIPCIVLSEPTHQFSLLSPMGVSKASPGKYLIADRGLLALVSYDSKSHQYKIISGPKKGSGSPFQSPIDVIALNVDRSIILDPSSGTIIRVDNKTGDRTIIPNSKDKVCQAMAAPRAMALLNQHEVAVSDIFNLVIYTVNLNNGTCHILSGSSHGKGPSFIQPQAITYAKDGALLVADSGYHTLMRVDTKTGNRQMMFSGDKQHSKLMLVDPISLTETKNKIFVGERARHAIISIDKNNGHEETIAKQKNLTPTSLSVEKNGDLIVADLGHRDIKEIHIAKQTMMALTHFDKAMLNHFYSPFGIALYNKDTVLVTDPQLVAVVKINLKSHKMQIVSSAGHGQGPMMIFPMGITVGDQKIYLADLITTAISSINMHNGNRVLVSNATKGKGPIFLSFTGLALDGDDIVGVDQHTNALFKISATSGHRAIISGSKQGKGPLFDTVIAITSMNNGDYAVSMPGQSEILGVNLKTGNRYAMSSKKAGSGAPIKNPMGLTYMSGALYATASNALLTKIDLKSLKRTTIPKLKSFADITPMMLIGSVDNRVFATDAKNKQVVSINVETGKIETIFP